jgi:hypothetical protein
MHRSWLVVSLSICLSSICHAQSDQRLQPAFSDLLVDTKFFVLDAQSGRTRFRFNRAAAEGGGSDYEFLPEITYGLTDHWQLGISEEAAKSSGESWHHAALLAEIRYAPYQWTKDAFNPSFGFTYESVPRGPEIIKLSAYGAREFADSAWLLATSATYQKRLGGDRERELIGKLALHKVLQDSRVSIGVEAKFENAKTYDANNSSVNELLIGPALIWMPADAWTLRLGSFFGVTSESPGNETTLVVECAF